MMLDWAVSLLVVSLIVFGLVAVSLDFFQNVDHDYVLRDGLQSTSQTVAQEIDRLEGIPATESQPFWYNSTTIGVIMPTDVAGSRYNMEFTPDFVVSVSNGSGPTVGAYAAVTEPVHLFPENMTLQLGLPTTHISGYHLHAMDQLYPCSNYPPGTNFNATVELVDVDGASTYLTFVYATLGQHDNPLHTNYLC